MHVCLYRLQLISAILHQIMIQQLHCIIYSYSYMCMYVYIIILLYKLNTICATIQCQNCYCI